MITTGIWEFGCLPVRIQPERNIDITAAVAPMETYRLQMESHNCQQPYYFSVLSQFASALLYNNIIMASDYMIAIHDYLHVIERKIDDCLVF